MLRIHADQVEALARGRRRVFEQRLASELAANVALRSIDVAAAIDRAIAWGIEGEPDVREIVLLEALAGAPLDAAWPFVVTALTDRALTPTGRLRVARRLVRDAGIDLSPLDPLSALVTP